MPITQALVTNLIKLLSWRCFALLLVMTNSAWGQGTTEFNDLSLFQDPPGNWKAVSGVRTDFSKDLFDTSEGSGIIVNIPGKKNRGKDLLSKIQHGDVDLEFDYMMAKGSNSGIQLQGRYEIQLVDSWGVVVPRAGDNGGITGRLDQTNLDRQMGYPGYAPRQNVSRAPGLWQHVKVSFQSPRFDASGAKTGNAKILRMELNGVVVHENVELSGADESPKGPLQIQGNAGAIAFRNMIMRTYDGPRPSNAGNDMQREKDEPVDPIPVSEKDNRLLRSFMDMPGGHRVVRAVSIGHPSKVHYTYDMDNGSVVHVWRGDFLDATPMWHSRGDGSSRPAGSVRNFGKVMPAVARLTSPQSPWIADTTGTGFRQRGYTLSENEEPTFRYETFGAIVTDAVKVIDQGRGIQRTIVIDNSTGTFYVRLAAGKSIEQLSSNLFLIDDKSYYLKLDDLNGMKPVVRGADGEKEMIVPVQSKIVYSVLF